MIFPNPLLIEKVNSRLRMDTGADFVMDQQDAGALPRVGREHQFAFAVEHADVVDALLVRDCLHDFIGSLAPIIQHGVPRRAGDTSGKLIGADYLWFQPGGFSASADPGTR